MDSSQSFKFLAPSRSYFYAFQICDASAPDDFCPVRLEKLSHPVDAINQLLFSLTFYSFLRSASPQTSRPKRVST